MWNYYACYMWVFWFLYLTQKFHKGIIVYREQCIVSIKENYNE